MVAVATLAEKTAVDIRLDRPSLREGRVRQRTLLNLGRHFDVPREQWPGLARRIEQLVSGQGDMMAVDLEPQWEEAAQRYGAPGGAGEIPTG